MLRIGVRGGVTGINGKRECKGKTGTQGCTMSQVRAPHIDFFEWSGHSRKKEDGV